MTIIYSARPSHGARELANALGIKQGSRRTTRKYTGTVINWGTLDLPKRFSGARIINPPEAIAEVSNKLVFFNKMKGTNLCPKFTEDWNKAQGWIDKGRRVVSRTILSGSSGIGIRIAGENRPLIQAPLYVEYIPKDSEWRVHVFRMKNGPEIIDIQKKARPSHISKDDIDMEVRNHDNGWIFKRDGIDPPECVKQVACQCMEALSLDFGAVDVIYSKKKKRAYVLEVNSAPGLEGTTVIKYAEAMKGMLGL